MKINLFPCRYYIIALVLLALPAVVQAQFIFTTNNGAITITGYTGQGGAVVIPNATNGYSVTGIGIDAFLGCTSLTGVTIPGSITTIGVEAFLGCTSLTNISVNNGNPSYSSVGGVLFDRGQETLIAYPEGLTNTTYAIPSASIGQEAFSECDNLTSVFIDSSVNRIGNLAFYECTGLTSIFITNRYTESRWQGPTSIGEEAFAYCTGVTNVFIANTVTNIGGLAFAYCINLTSVNFQGNAPPDAAGNIFYGDPSAVVYYQPGATGWGAMFGDAPTVGLPTPPSEFDYSINDGSITITHYNEPIGTLNDGPVVIPNTINGYIVTGIGQGAFQDAYAPSVTIPNTVTSIGQNAFYGCNMTNFTIPNGVTNIGGGAFEYCPGLTGIIIPDSVTSIGQDAFFHCESMMNIIIGNGVTSVGNEAFEYCSGLTSITIPSGVASIGQYAFSDCTNLTSAYFLGNAPPNVAGVFYDDAAAVVYFWPGTTGWGGTFSSTRTVDALTYATNDGSITITGFVGPGPEGAVVIPGAISGYTVTGVGIGAFAYCGNLTAITVPASVTNLEGFAFAFCTNLISAYFQGNAPSNTGNFFYGDLATVYYLPGTGGWGVTFGGVRTEPWFRPQPVVLGFEPTFGVHNHQFGFPISWATNASIIVEACTNLSNPAWIPVATNGLSNGTNYFSDSQWTNYPFRFYRLTAP